MNDSEFLKMIFDGYCNCYRKNNWHTAATYADMTQKELTFFEHLGESLGFLALREKWLMDLAWFRMKEQDGKFLPLSIEDLVLYLERENLDWKVQRETMNKMLDSDESKAARYLVCVLGWVTPHNFETIVETVREKIHDRNLLLIAWVGENQEQKNWDVCGVVWSGGERKERIVNANMDNSGFWYVHFPSVSQWK